MGNFPFERILAYEYLTETQQRAADNIYERYRECPSDLMLWMYQMGRPRGFLDRINFVLDEERIVRDAAFERILRERQEETKKINVANKLSIILKSSHNLENNG